ncbi:hypothetical protein [Lactococcus fujiensis]|uniref:Uncharacterized protein n=2 Tax=Lactococcus fujiensis TaxID=610251 RepID=A0A2A5RN31_9LACT|nr:hypothetical protein [Lactococcus fujiensis]PCS00746.1 hypothetical protein RT41_GL001128 [Lactococcus fujiensis JCM 16395]
MRTTRATEEIEKAIIHLKKAKREISNYTFDYDMQNLIQLDRTIKQLEAIRTAVNADGNQVEGVKSIGQLESERLSRARQDVSSLTR